MSPSRIVESDTPETEAGKLRRMSRYWDNCDPRLYPFDALDDTRFVVPAPELAVEVFN
jgi:hypothetical protein